MGLEPTIFRFVAGRLIHWATRPVNRALILAFIMFSFDARVKYLLQIYLNYRARYKYIRLKLYVTILIAT